MFEKYLSFKNFFLFGFVFFCLLGSWAVIERDVFLDVAFKNVRYTFLILFYLASSKKINYQYLISVGLFLISSVYFSWNNTSLLGITLLGLSRIPLINILFEKMKKGYLKTFKIVFLMFLGFLAVVMSLLYKSSAFFYISIISSLLLVILIALSFALLLGDDKKKLYSLIFIGVFLFVVADAVFGAKKIQGTNHFNLLMSALIYNLGYYLITNFMIKMDN